MMPAGLTDLVGADPFALDGPCAEAFVMWIIAGKVAVFNQTASGVPAMEMDDFELHVCKLHLR